MSQAKALGTYHLVPMGQGCPELEGMRRLRFALPYPWPVSLHEPRPDVLHQPQPGDDSMHRQRVRGIAPNMEHYYEDRGPAIVTPRDRPEPGTPVAYVKPPADDTERGRPLPVV
jgi:hypothetical protein